jgi:hypothetical protein
MPFRDTSSGRRQIALSPVGTFPEGAPLRVSCRPLGDCFECCKASEGTLYVHACQTSRRLRRTPHSRFHVHLHIIVAIHPQNAKAARDTTFISCSAESPQDLPLRIGAGIVQCCDRHGGGTREREEREPAQLGSRLYFHVEPTPPS